VLKAFVVLLVRRGKMLTLPKSIYPWEQITQVWKICWLV